ncbi:hypothetical protein BO221_48960 [Archangium sp. Cb G35]|nr:hypothetical protein BO221_48960 [Archangium sp. Cb G35]
MLLIFLSSPLLFSFIPPFMELLDEREGEEGAVMDVAVIRRQVVLAANLYDGLSGRIGLTVEPGACLFTRFERGHDWRKAVSRHLLEMVFEVWVRDQRAALAITRRHDDMVFIVDQDIGQFGRIWIGSEPGLRFFARLEGRNHPGRGLGFDIPPITLEIIRPAISPDEPECVDGQEKQFLLLRRLRVFTIFSEELLRFDDSVEDRHGASAVM